MALSAKERKALDKMWKGSNENMGSNIDAPDGQYQFKITKASFKTTQNGKPGINTEVKIVGGDKDYVGIKGKFRDNLETAENMGWFKRKIKRLGLRIPKSISDIVDGSLLEGLIGLVFDGQLKTTNDFQNLYVNKLVKKSQKHQEEDDNDDDPDDDEDDDDNDEVDDVDEEDTDEDDDDDDYDASDEDDDDDNDVDDDDDDDPDDDDDDDDIEWPSDINEVKSMTKADCKNTLISVDIKPGADPKKTLTSLVAVESKKKIPSKEFIRIARACGLEVSSKDTSKAGIKKVGNKLRKHLKGMFE